MKHVIVGTAGHVDHGKTSLVKALTGIDADRLAEEKRRGITIDLGFAHLELGPSLRAGFIDVPGHERFVKNMLAGVGGIDLVLFVVAADESIKPQTREHFDICRMLGIERGIVALTKCDLVHQEILDLVRLEIEELISGSFLRDAPILPVSSVTGAGLDELRAALARAAAEAPARDSAGHFRLPIDRAFSMKGFGAVITGTLISGAIEKEREVELHPSGRRLRVRGVQVHGQSAERAVAGQRTAINLAGIEASDLGRGQVLTDPDRFRAVTQLDCQLHLLLSAKSLKTRAPVHFHSGTAEIEAEVRLLNGDSTLQAGDAAYVRIVLREPALLLPGDRFIIRKFSPVTTIGGGVIVDTCGVRYRKTDDALVRLNALASPDVSLRVAQLISEARYGMTLAELVARTGLTESEILRATQKAPVIAVNDAPLRWMDRAAFQSAAEALVAAVRDYHAGNPLRPGIAREDLRGAQPTPVFDALLGASPGLVAEGGIIRLRTHRVELQQDEEAARTAIEYAFAVAGLAVPTVNEALAQSGIHNARARAVMQILLREKRLIRITAELVFHHSAIDHLRALMSVRRTQRFNVTAFKEWTGVSRKYAIPLLEFLDRERITRRDGEERVVI